MTRYRQRAARIERDNPIRDKHKLWAAWFWGCIAHHHPDRARCPAHPTLAREYHNGRGLAAAGFVRVPDFASAAELARHVEAGNAPHTFTGAQLGMAL